jgi:uncharacterized membrane protein
MPSFLHPHSSRSPKGQTVDVQSAVMMWVMVAGILAVLANVVAAVAKMIN